LSPFVTLALFCLPALTQTQFSGQITSNVGGASATLANPVYYNETVNQVGVSTTGALSCAAYPQITFWFTRGGVQQVLGFVVTSAGTSWTAVPAVTTLQPGDLLFDFFGGLSSHRSKPSLNFPRLLTKNSRRV
jgi:hypothetical protein